MFKAALDLGGSNTRIAKSKTDIVVTESTVLGIDVDAPVKTYIEDKYSDFIIDRHPRKHLSNTRYVRGEGIGHYKGQIFVCDNQDVKVEQDVTYINATYIIAKKLIEEFKDNAECLIGVCIPTSEFYSEAKDYPSIFKKGMAGTHSVEFPLLGKTVTFTLTEDTTKVLPEGVVAARKFSKDREFVTTNTLIVDIGYRSSDITLLNRFSPVGKSAVSRPKGGVNLEAALRNELERANILVSNEEVKEALETRYVLYENSLYDVTQALALNYELDAENYADNAAEDISKEHRIAIGGKEVTVAMRSYYILQKTIPVDITDKVTAAKKVFASSLKQDIVDVLASDMKNISSVSNIMPVGRPFSGDRNDPNNLINLLVDELGGDLRIYAVPNLATANVEEVIGVLNPDGGNV